MLRSSIAGGATEVSKLLSGVIVRGLVVAPSFHGSFAGISQAGDGFINARNDSVLLAGTKAALSEACEDDVAELIGNGSGAAHLHLYEGALPAGKVDASSLCGSNILFRPWPRFQSAKFGSLTTSAWQADALVRQHSHAVHCSALSSKDAGMATDDASTQGQVSEGSGSADTSGDVEVAEQVAECASDAPDAVGAEAATSTETATRDGERSVSGSKEMHAASQQEVDQDHAEMEGMTDLQTEGERNFAREQVCTVTIVAKAFEPEMVEYFQDSVLADWVDEEEPTEALEEGTGEGPQALLDDLEEADAVSLTNFAYFITLQDGAQRFL